MVCVSSMYVVRLCVGNDAICLILAVGYMTLVFLFLLTLETLFQVSHLP